MGLWVAGKGREEEEVEEEEKQDDRRGCCRAHSGEEEEEATRGAQGKRSAELNERLESRNGWQTVPWRPQTLSRFDLALL